MTKKVKVDDLRVGMFVERFGRSWMHHPFVFNSALIKDRETIDKLREWGIKHVYIDPEQSVDEVEETVAETCEPEPPVGLEQVVSDEPFPPGLEPANHVPLDEELVRARQIKEEAVSLARKFLHAVQDGGKVEVDEVNQLVLEMDSSIRGNKDALLVLMRLRSKDDYTYVHSVSVGALLVAFSRAMGFDDETTRVLGLGGVLHDVGKMSVPLDVLNKPGKLTDEEYGMMKEHVLHCQGILKASDRVPQEAIFVATQHHERFDGTGYPYGLKGEEISIGGQMAAICDVFDALTSDRCYRRGIEQIEVLRMLFNMGEKHFDAGLVQKFIKCIGVYPVGTLVQLESGLLGVVVESTDELLRPVVRVFYDVRQDWPIVQRSIDLSKTTGREGADRIVSYENPRKWKVDPHKVLDL